MMLTAACVALLVQQVVSLSASARTWQIDEVSFIHAWLLHGRSCNDSVIAKPTPPPDVSDLSEVTPKMLGCFSINGSQDTGTEFTLHIQGPKFNTSACMNACLEKGRIYFALQNAGDCYCGQEDFNTKTLSKNKVKDCGAVCASEFGLRPTHFCGDNRRRVVYNVAGISSKYVGCYHDDKEVRDFPERRPGSNFTIKTCMQTCIEYDYMALQSGNSCFCGNSYGTNQTKHFKMPDDKCGGPCDGEGDFCGGKYANAIYSLGKRSLSNSKEVRAIQNGKANTFKAMPATGKNVAPAKSAAEMKIPARQPAHANKLRDEEAPAVSVR